MKVYKFGGASINSYDRIRNLANILREQGDGSFLIVISAMGKVTNALEKVAENYYASKPGTAMQLLAQIKEQHLNLLKYLVTQKWQQATDALLSHFDPIEKLLKTVPEFSFDYYYDQIVSSGELFSSTLISFYLDEEKLENCWVDARAVLKTDTTARSAKVNWETTSANIETLIQPLFNYNKYVITQGFIGSSDSGHATTLGREGSDYTAAVFGKIMHAQSVTIWKDVPGVMTGDPKQYPAAIVLPQLSYKEVIEMAYYGAQVIHPKTVKPLQNSNIPLYVKSFLQPELAGTLINAKRPAALPPVIVYKHNQALLTLESLDYSFVEGEPINVLHRLLDGINIKPNLTQNTAISLLICIDDEQEVLQKIAFESAALFEVQIRKNLTLLTIRHYDNKIVAELTKDKQIMLEQKTPETLQVLF